MSTMSNPVSGKQKANPPIENQKEHGKSAKHPHKEAKYQQAEKTAAALWPLQTKGSKH